MTRNPVIDVAKGFGILLVVFGHNWIVLNTKGKLFEIIFSFHMPLFFFLSGIFLRRAIPVSRFAALRFNSLLKPYLLTLLIVGALKFANSLIKSRGRPTRSFDYLSYVGEVLYGNGHIAGGWAPLWFLPHLFVSSLVALLIIKLTESTWHLLIVSLLSLAIGASVLGSIELPWGADLVPISLAFLLLGYLCRDYLQSMRFDALYFGLALCVFAGCHVLFHATIDLNERVYGEFPIATLQALTGIYLSLSVSTLLTQLGILSAALCYLGSSTLFILLFHAFVQGMSFGILSRYLQSPYPSAILSFLLGVSVPLAMREVVKRVEFSRLWFSSVRH